MMAPPLVCLSWPDGVLHRTDAWQAKVCELIPGGIVGHHFAYDAAVMCATDPGMWPILVDAYERDLVTDTMLRQKLLDVAAGIRSYEDENGKAIKVSYSLDGVARRLCGIQLDKSSVRLRYQELWDVPISQWHPSFYHYARDDARATQQVWQAQESQSTFLQDQYRQARAAFWIQLMAVWGLRTDLKAIERLESRVREEHNILAADLLTQGLLRRERKGLVKNIKVVAERVAWAYSSTGREIPLTPKGNVECDRETCLTSGDALLAQYSAFGRLNTLLSGDLDRSGNKKKHPLWEGVNAPIHSRFDTILETGRTSSSAPNVQNKRRDGFPCKEHKAFDARCENCVGVRECFVPREGLVYVAADYGGLELCTLAQTCVTLLGRSSLADILNADKDPHMMVAADILGWSYEQCKAYKDDPAYAKMIDDARQTGKVANFGFPGGLGANALVHFAKQTYNVTLTVDEAKALKNTWFRILPEMRDYFQLIDQMTKSQGYIIQLFSGRYRGGPSYTAACNSFFQGLGADIAKAAGWEVMKLCYRENKARIVNFVHDELVTEVHPDYVQEWAPLLSKTMIDAAKPWLPDVKIKVSVAAMKRYSKGAKGLTL
jgi:hypothetical protein